MQKSLRVLPALIFLLLPGIFFLPNTWQIQPILTLDIDPTQTMVDKIWPVWDSLNLWDPYLVGNGMNATTFAADHPFIRRLVLMTATGGRYGGTNDYLDKGMYNYSVLDHAIDWILATKCEPVIVIGSVPHDLALDPTAYGVFATVNSPPKDYSAYELYIATLATHIRTRYGNVNWEFRLWTEPDNRDMWNASWDAFINLYIVNMLGLRCGVQTNGSLAAWGDEQGLSAARLAMGNMMNIDDHGLDLMEQLLVKVANEETRTGIPIRPQFVGGSCYGRGQVGIHPYEIQARFQKWADLMIAHPEWGADGEFPTLVVGEGQILHDEDGKYLWSGDGTEVGATWQAGMIFSALNTHILHFTEWEVLTDSVNGLRGPTFWVDWLMDRMINSTRLQLHWESPLLNDHRWVDALGSVDPQSGIIHACIFAFDTNRQTTFAPKIRVHVVSAAVITYSLRSWRIDVSENNFMTEWNQDSRAIPRVSYEDLGGSRWDLNIGMGFGTNTSSYAFYWNWKQDHPQYMSQQEPHEWQLSNKITAGNSITTHQVEFSAGVPSVTFLELIPEAVL